MHIGKLGVPVAFMCMIYSLRNRLHDAFNSHTNSPEETIASALGGSEGAEARFVEYAFCVALPYVAMITMLTFVWHVASEKQSGFRRLLHISGVSRTAYVLATAGIEGVFQCLVALFLMLSFAGCMLHLRMVVWTSPALLAITITLLATSAVALGYLLHFVCVSEKMSSMVGKLILTCVLFKVIALPFSSVAPMPGQQSYMTLAFPPIPAARALFELSIACKDGRCLTYGDVVAARFGASPWEMVVGVQGAVDDTRDRIRTIDNTPPEGILSLFGLLVCQLFIFWALIIFFDAQNHPALHVPSKASKAAENNTGLLVVRGLVHSYGLVSRLSGTREHRVLDDVSFSIPAGGMLGLLGPNGSGKTTTIRCITGEEVAREGHIAVDTTSDAAYIGLCPQETVLNSDLSVAENLLFFAYIRGAQGKAAGVYVSQMLATVRLEDKRDDFPDTLSGGMRRRLAVACAMIAQPRVTILDEPTTGLDPISRRGIWSTINEIKVSGGCCLLTTHMLEEAEALATQIVVLRKGTVAAQGTVQALKQTWGDGYLLSIDSESVDAETAKMFVESLLSERDRNPIRTTELGQLTFKLTCSGESLGHLIIKIARGQKENGVRHWGVSQASLEDTYLRIIQQGDPDAVDSKAVGSIV
jgi:ABC-2 type transport system ATP-binding protein